jgi:5'-deoxynucleotidase
MSGGECFDRLMHARRLRKVTRWAGELAHSRETVADHSYYVALIAMEILEDAMSGTLVKYLQTNDGNRLQRAMVMRGRLFIYDVVRLALYHDAGEALTGDIIWPMKHDKENSVDVKKAIALIERHANLKMMPKDAMDEADDNSPAYWIVKYADTVDLCLTVIEDAELGNRSYKTSNTASLLYDKYALPMSTEFIDCLDRHIRDELDRLR